MLAFLQKLQNLIQITPLNFGSWLSKVKKIALTSELFEDLD